DSTDKEELAAETGDLLFALVNLARHIDADPEMALRGANPKFERRFAYIERALAAKGRGLARASLTEMDALWDEANAKETRLAPSRRKAYGDCDGVSAGTRNAASTPQVLVAGHGRNRPARARAGGKRGILAGAAGAHARRLCGRWRPRHRRA